MTIGFAKVIEYLDAIVSEGNDPDDAPHKAFWRVDRATFISMTVPHVVCVQGSEQSPIRVVVPFDADNSPLLKILSADRAVCNKRQMPGGGPFVTDAGYSITLNDGTKVPGQQILTDLSAWITAGCPD